VWHVAQWQGRIQPPCGQWSADLFILLFMWGD
jgi:hypothetical protein